MKIEWLNEAHSEFREFVTYYNDTGGKIRIPCVVNRQYVCVYKLGNDTGQTDAYRRNEKFCSRPFSITLSPVLGTITLSKAPIASLRRTIPPVRFAPGGMVYILYMCFILAQGKWQLNVWQLSFLEIV